MGSILLPEEWDVPVCYGAMAERASNSATGAWWLFPKVPISAVCSNTGLNS